MAGDPPKTADTDALAHKPLRSAATLKIKAFACAACGGQVTVSLPDRSLAAVCSSCGAIVDATDDNHKVLSAFIGGTKYQPLIPLGSRGKLHGHTYRVIGYVRKSDGPGDYHWNEYLLFNPYQGYRWLVENQGHWSYVVPLRAAPKSETTARIYNGRSYKLFLKGEAKVVYVLGEFYWQLAYGEKTIVADYIAPPEMLSMEKSGSEINWSLGEYIHGSLVRKAFALTGSFPQPIGVAPNQPSPTAAYGPLGALSAMVAVALLAVQIVTAALVDDQKVHKVELTHIKDKPAQEYLSEPFELKGRVSNVETQLQAGVDQSWLELELSLVNDDTGGALEYRQLAEYYHGHDSDGSWSEGSRSDSFVLTDVPPGRYRLRAVSYAENDTSYQITVYRDRAIWSNLVFLLLSVMVFPVFVWIRRAKFETARWQNSEA